MTLRALTLTSLAALAVTLSAHATTFGFENSDGATPTFSVTSGGNTATFTSPAGNNFMVQSTSGLFTFTPALVDNNFNPDALTITFATQISGDVEFAFGFQDAFSTSTDALTVLTNTGQTITVDGVPDNLVFGFQEGVVNLSLNAPVSSLVLTGTSPFGIGDVTTGALPVSATPEPSSIALLATGLAGFAMRRRA